MDENGDAKKGSISVVKPTKGLPDQITVPKFKQTRRRYLRLLDKKFQFKVLLLVLLLVVATHLIFAVSIYHDIGKTSKILNYMVPEVAEGIRNLKVQVILNMFLTIAASSAVVVILSLYFTNRISGPLFNMTRVMRKLATGDFNQSVRIRTKDELKSFADEMNNMIASLRQRKLEIESLKKRLRLKDIDNLPSILADVEETLDRL